MQDRNEDGGDKIKALRSQVDLCRRLVQETGDPVLAERLRNLVDKLEHRESVAGR
jgi:hypothetical protein